jgi:hypothetical protein
MWNLPEKGKTARKNAAILEEQIRKDVLAAKKTL